MKSMAVVLSKNSDFKKMFEEGSPFVKGISYWTYMLKEELKKLDIELIEYKGSAGRDNYQFIFHFDRFRKDVIKKYPNSLHIYLGFEPQVVDISHTSRSLKKLAKYVYDAVITVRTDIEAERVFNVFLPSDIHYVGDATIIPKKLGCLLSGDKVGFGKELYSKRREIIKYAEVNEKDSFSFFGPSWKKPYSSFKTYKGHADSKLELAKEYKYNFCLENEYGTPGAVSEKIFDAMSVGMVPVYYGAPDIDKYVPKDCFIDFGGFSDVKECFEYLKSISDEEYLEKKQKIRDFMTSEQTREKFSAKEMALSIKKIIDQNKCHKNRKIYILDSCNLKKYCYLIACILKRMIAR